MGAASSSDAIPLDAEESDWWSEQKNDGSAKSLNVGQLSERGNVDVPMTRRKPIVSKTAMLLAQQTVEDEIATLEALEETGDDEDAAVLVDVLAETEPTAVVAHLREYGHSGAITEACITRGMQLVMMAPALRTSQIAADFLALLVDALDFHETNEYVAKWGCTAIADFASQPEPAQVVVKAGGLAALLQAMKRFPGSVDVQTAGCRGVCSLCSGVTKAAYSTKEAAADSGALEAAVAALRTHEQEATVQVWGVGVVAVIVASGKAIEPERLGPCIEAVVRAMDAHPSCEEVYAETAAAVGNLCHGVSKGSLKIKEHLFAAAAVEALTRGLLTFEGSAEAQAYGCGALANLCRGSSGAVKSASKMGADALAKGAISRFAAHQGVQKKAKALLANLKGR